MSDSTEKIDLSESIVIKIKDQSYTIKFPNTGQLIDIENKKASLRPRNINFITESGTIANLLVDSTATFDILCPKMMSDLNVNIFDLSLMQSRSIMKAYLKEFLPWYNGWMEIISNFDAA